MKNLAIILAISGIGTWFAGEAEAQVVLPPVVVVPTAAYPVRPAVGRRRTYYAPIPVASSATYTVTPATTYYATPTVVSTPAYQATPKFQSEASAADFAPVITNYPSATTYGTSVVGGVTTNYAPPTVTTYRVDSLAPTIVTPPAAMPFPRTVTYPPNYQTPNIRGYGN